MFDVNAKTGEVFLYDEIGPSWMGMIDADIIIAALDQLGGKRATVRINSPGGVVDDGIAIYNALERYQGGVDVVIDSLAASAASYIAMIGEKITIAKNARIMIHSPWTLAMGNSQELRNTADTLDKYTASLVGVYSERTGRTVEEVQSLLDAETWFIADEAVANGFANEIGNPVIEEQPMIAAGRYKNTPRSLLIQPQDIAAKAGTRTPFHFKRQEAELKLRLAQAK